MIIAFLSSVAAGVAGLYLEADSKTVGAIALLPGFVSLASAAFKPQGRANWHWQKPENLSDLRGKLINDLSGATSVEERLRFISDEKSKKEKEMSDEWYKNFGLDPSSLLASSKRKTS
jgi:hypothetical protein